MHFIILESSCVCAICVDFCALAMLLTMFKLADIEPIVADLSAQSVKFAIFKLAFQDLATELSDHTSYSVWITLLIDLSDEEPDFILYPSLSYF